MLSKRLQIVPQDLDPRLLWSSDQTTIYSTYERLVEKCRQIEGYQGCILVTTGEVPEHWVAAFNLTMAHSLCASIVLVDTTTKAHIQSDLLGIPSTSAPVHGLVSKHFLLMSMLSEELFLTRWPSAVHGMVGDHMFALMHTKDVFKLDWASNLNNVAVIALASPNDLEEERWQRLAELVGTDRFQGLWVID